MGASEVDELRDRVKELRARIQEFQQAAGDFPALIRNAARVEASLTMMAIDLGLPQEGLGDK